MVTTEEFQSLMGKTGFESVPHEMSEEKGFFFYSKRWNGKRVAAEPRGGGVASCHVIIEFAAQTSRNPTPWWRFWLADGLAGEAVDKLWEGRQDGSCRLTQQYTRLGAPLFLEESVKGLDPHDITLIAGLFRLVEDTASAMTEEGKAAAEERRAARLREIEEREARQAAETVRIQEEKRVRAERIQARIARIAALPPYVTTQQCVPLVLTHFAAALPPGDVSDWKLFCKE
jgi:hypothetical protein